VLGLRRLPAERARNGVEEWKTAHTFSMALVICRRRLGDPDNQNFQYVHGGDTRSYRVMQDSVYTY
jgi:hypothetical protein